MTGVEPLDRYTEGVRDGTIDVCKWVKLAVERHYRDLERSKSDDYPYKFEPDAVTHYTDFFRDELKHFDGVFAGKPISFEDWQYFVWGSPFGWIHKERKYDMPIRRFKEVIILIPKKQGKSLIIAGTVLYMIDKDEYPGAQVYMLANNREQVKGLGYRDAEKLVEGSSVLRNLYRVNRSAGDRGIYYDAMNSFVKPQTSKPETSDGLKVHCVANDEVKDWVDFEIYDIMRDGTSTDPNSLVFNITTAGSNTESLGYERQRYLEKILKRQIEDETTFGIIYGVDKEDEENWDSLEVAKKANPNYGVSVDEDYFADRILKAKESKRSKAAYLTKQLNQWGHSASGWIDISKWDEAGQDIKAEDFKDLPAIVSVDLSSKIDLTEVKLVFYDGFNGDEVKMYSFSRFYIPEARLMKTDDRQSDAYRNQLLEWSEEWITVAGEQTIDYKHVKEDIKGLFKDYKVQKLAYDPWNATQLINDLQDEGLPVEKMVEYSQTGYKNWSEPMKQTEAMILEKRIIHDKNPVMRWCMGNIGVKEDKLNQNIRPMKLVDTDKIDGAVNLIMAVGTHMYAVDEEEANLSPAALRAMKRAEK